MEIIKERTVAILGTDSGVRGSKLRSRIVEQLSVFFEREIIQNGVDTFISPLKMELDWLAGDAFSRLRERYPMIRFISVNVVINSGCRVYGGNYKSVSRGCSKHNRKCNK